MFRHAGDLAYERFKFSTWQAGSDNWATERTNALNACKRWVDEAPERVAGGRGIVLAGTVGSGKDHLLVATLRAAAARWSIACHWINCRDLFAMERDRIGRGEQSDSVMLNLANVELLALSDPLPAKGELGEYLADFLYRLIRKRVDNMRPTMLSVNVLTDDQGYTRLGPPTWDRFKERADLIICQWPGFRGEARVVNRKAK